MLTYFDRTAGKSRVKSRYKYAAVALGLGFIVGLAATRLLH